MDEEEINAKLRKGFIIAAKISYWGGLLLIGIAFNWLLALAMFLVISGIRHLIDVSYEKAKTACSYLIELSIQPKWEAIWEHYFSGLSVDEIVADPILKIDREQSLYFKNAFNYDIFICENPPLKLIWSHHYQKFMGFYYSGKPIEDNLLASGLDQNERNLLRKGLLKFSSGGNDPLLKEKIRDVLLGKFYISPDRIGFSPTPSISGVALAQFPYTSIIQALLLLHRTPNAKNGRGYKKTLSRLKIIGSTLKAQLAEYQVDATYSNLQYLWGDADSREMKFMQESTAGTSVIGFHSFETKFHTVLLTLTPFDSADVDFMSTSYRPF